MKTILQRTKEPDRLMLIVTRPGGESLGLQLPGVPEDVAEFIARACETHQLLVDALEAIRARIEGEWDNPALMAFGPLLPNPEEDVLRIVDSAHPRV